MPIRVIEGWQGLPPSDQGASVALGNFDGVHKGHAAVIADARAAAIRHGVPLAAATFEPHPRLMFQPDAPPFRLTSPNQQARALEALGVERLYVLPFDPAMAGMSDREFATDVLAGGLGARHVAVGFDISFGKGRTGTPDAMQTYGEALGFSVSVTAALGDGAEKFSSTAIRAALRAGDPSAAAAILGRPFAIEGRVERGRQLGRTLGYPTVNIALGDYVTPRLGVYAARVRLPDGKISLGAANIGVNPTVGEVEARLEVYILDFSGDLYGQVLDVELLEFIRPEHHFSNVGKLTEQIRLDVAKIAAGKYL